MPDQCTVARRAEASAWCKARLEALTAAIPSYLYCMRKFPSPEYGDVCEKVMEYARVAGADPSLLIELGATTVEGHASLVDAVYQVQLLADWLAATDREQPQESGEGQQSWHAPHQAAGVAGAGGPPPRLTVDVACKTITLDGETYDVTSINALRWVKVLADHPGEWISSTGLEKYDPELQNPRTDRWRPYLPEAVLSLIDSETGKGSRIRL